jgi:hypothetical protein
VHTLIYKTWFSPRGLEPFLIEVKLKTKKKCPNVEHFLFCNFLVVRERTWSPLATPELLPWQHSCQVKIPLRTATGCSHLSRFKSSVGKAKLKNRLAAGFLIWCARSPLDGTLFTIVFCCCVKSYSKGVLLYGHNSLSSQSPNT